MAESKFVQVQITGKGYLKCVQIQTSKIYHLLTNI
jgi:hypothetical protein